MDWRENRTALEHSEWGTARPKGTASKGENFFWKVTEEREFVLSL